MEVRWLESRTSAQRLADAKSAARATWARLRWRRRPPWPGFGEPLNGQAVRRKTFQQLVAQFSPGAFIETGTFIGATTGYLAGFGIDTYTVEVNPGFQALARLALRNRPNVTLICGDSVDGINWLAEEAEIERPLAYLDAHWEERVPLGEEIESIFGRWPDALAVIDDIFVPGEPGYGYDIYAGVALAVENLSLPDGVILAYPSAPPIEESGARRGTAFIARGFSAQAALEFAEKEGMVKIALSSNTSNVTVSHEEAVDLK